jgi:hypothetical protein
MWRGTFYPLCFSTNLYPDLTKVGEPDRLRFPNFHSELLSQSYWNPADDLGRLKVVLAEGFSGEQFGFERVKNLVAFSFQHAPLGMWLDYYQNYLAHLDTLFLRIPI